MSMATALPLAPPIPEAVLPRLVDPVAAEAMTAAAARDAATLSVNGRAVSARVTAVTPLPAPVRMLYFSVAGELCWAAVPHEFLAAMQVGHADGEMAALLLEAALASALDWAETQGAGPIRLRELDPRPVTLAGAHHAGELATSGLALRHEQTAFEGALHLGPAGMAVLAQLVRRLRRRQVALDAIPVQLCLRAGVTDLSLDELASLRPGDAVVLAETGLQDGRLVVAIGERKVAIGRTVQGGVSLEAAPRRDNTKMGRRWLMSDGVQDPVEDEVGCLRVTLVFELGRRLASLAEIAAMGPGSVVQTGGAPDQSVDVLANGRSIGRGTLVQVGGAFAVQLQRINHGGLPS